MDRWLFKFCPNKENIGYSHQRATQSMGEDKELDQKYIWHNANQNMCCGYFYESPHCDSSFRYSEHMYLSCCFLGFLMLTKHKRKFDWQSSKVHSHWPQSIRIYRTIKPQLGIRTSAYLMRISSGRYMYRNVRLI